MAERKTAAEAIAATSAMAPQTTNTSRIPAASAAAPARPIESRLAPPTVVAKVACARPRAPGGTSVWRIVVTDAWTGVTNQPTAK